MASEQPTLLEAAQAILNRWESPQWEWEKHGHTASLIADLRRAVEAASLPLRGSGYVRLTSDNQPPPNSTVVYWHKSPSGGYPAIADEWNWYDHGPIASHWLPASLNPPKPTANTDQR